MCCTSLRGVAFFGASVHIAVGFVLFSRYVIATVVFTFYNFNNLFSEKVTAFLAPFMVYVTLLLALGLVIFHSVEKEAFVLLKWSSVAFSLLQLAVFVVILVLKLSPNYEYHQFPFLPESLVSSYVHGQSSPTSPTSSIHQHPAGPEVYVAIPHGTKVEEGDLPPFIRPSSKSPSSSDPPDPGGGGGTSVIKRGGGFELIIPTSSNMVNNSSRDTGNLQEIYRLTILIICVLLTLVYLIFLFLYIRQLNYEVTGNVFGHAGQAVTRSLAFYVQPQFVSSTLPQHQLQQQQGQGQGILLDNKAGIRSQTQIPQQFLPQPKGQQLQSQALSSSQTPSLQLQPSPKRVNQLLQQGQGQVQGHHQASTPAVISSSLEGSPKRVQRPSPQQQNVSILQNPNPSATYSPKRTVHTTDGGGGMTSSGLQTVVEEPGICDSNLGTDARPQQQQQYQHQHQQQQQQRPPQQQGQGHYQLPILGPSSVNLAQTSTMSPYAQTPTMRGPIPAQVRIGFYPQDLTPSQQQPPPLLPPHQLQQGHGMRHHRPMIEGEQQHLGPNSSHQGPHAFRGPPPPPPSHQHRVQFHQQQQHPHPPPPPHHHHHTTLPYHPQQHQQQQQHYPQHHPSSSSSWDNSQQQHQQSGGYLPSSSLPLPPHPQQGSYQTSTLTLGRGGKHPISMV